MLHTSNVHASLPKKVQSALYALRELLLSEVVDHHAFANLFTEHDLERFFHQYGPHCSTLEEQSAVIALFDPVREQLRQQYATLVGSREYGYATELLTHATPNRLDLGKTFLGIDIDTFAQKSGVRTGDTVLFIGSGPLPASALLYAIDTGCRVDCIEQSPEYATIAERVVKRYGRSAQVRTYHERGEAFTFKPDEYSLILIALMASPRTAILNHLRTMISPSTRIICRSTSGVEGLLYEVDGPATYDGYQLLFEEESADPHYHTFHLECRDV